MTAAEFAAALQATPTRFGSFALACPLCHASKAVTLSEKAGKVVVQCTCGCSEDRVCSALVQLADAASDDMLTEREARKRSANGHAANGHSKASGKAGKSTATSADFAAEAQRLAKLDDFSYQQERKRSATQLGVSVTFLDKAVEGLRVGGTDLPEIEPWPEPVEGAELLDAVAATIRRHVSVPTRGEEAVALWVLHAHCIDAAFNSPRLAITSAAPECGKSTLLRIVGDLVPRKLIASNISPASTFRSIERWSPTLLIDEADTFLRDSEELRGVLNSGHARAEAFVVRTVGDNHEPRRFNTWAAVVIAMIGQLPATLASRAIHIELQRLSRNERVERYLKHKAPYADLARRCARWAQDNIDALRDAEPDMAGIANRRADNWRPLFAIADRVGADWAGPSGRAREAALTLNHVEAGQTTAIMLLEDIRTVLGTAGRINSTTLARELAKMEGRPWPEFGKAKKPITTNAIARLLKPFNVAPDQMRDPDTNEVGKGYRAEPLRAVFDRYLP